jgi:hypothetical protein
VTPARLDDAHLSDGKKPGRHGALGEGDTLLHDVAGERRNWAMGEQQRWAKATKGEGDEGGRANDVP